MAASSKSKIYFFFKKPAPLKHRSRLKGFIEEIFRREKVPLLSLNYVFSSDQELLAMNRQYLKHDYYTDIITFELSEKGMPLEGEVYISIDRVKDNARLLGSSISKELHRVIFHGALHLCGYKDGTGAEKREMRDKEEKWLEQYF